MILNATLKQIGTLTARLSLYKPIALFFFFYFALTGSASANECQNLSELLEGNRRAFDDLSPISLDVDGDGKLDAINPHLYTQPATPSNNRSPFSEAKELHWIAFDLKTSSDRELPNFFQYNYGTDIADYWVYGLVACGDVNRDGKTDLIFYAGDDTSDETVVLIYEGESVRIHSKKVSESGE
jgi:hypothetical protein